MSRHIKEFECIKLRIFRFIMVYNPSNNFAHTRLAQTRHATNYPIASIWLENMLGYLSPDIICSSVLTVFLRAPLWEKIMFADKFPSIFSRQMEAVVYYSNKQLIATVAQPRSREILLKSLTPTWGLFS